MQRGPPRIGIPHLVATKFKLCSGVLYLRALGIPHLAASKFTIIQRKEQDKTAKLQQQLLLRPQDLHGKSTRETGERENGAEEERREAK
jgi:hypothetical protein